MASLSWWWWLNRPCLAGYPNCVQTQQDQYTAGAVLRVNPAWCLSLAKSESPTCIVWNSFRRTRASLKTLTLNAVAARHTFVPAFMFILLPLTTRNGSSSHWCAVIWPTTITSLPLVVAQWGTSLTSSKMRMATLTLRLKCNVIAFLSEDWRANFMLNSCLSFWPQVLSEGSPCWSTVVLWRALPPDASSTFANSFAKSQETDMHSLRGAQILAGRRRHYSMCLDETHRWRSADTIVWLRTHGLHSVPNSIKAEIGDLVYNGARGRASNDPPLGLWCMMLPMSRRLNREFCADVP